MATDLALQGHQHAPEKVPSSSDEEDKFKIVEVKEEPVDVQQPSLGERSDSESSNHSDSPSDDSSGDSSAKDTSTSDTPSPKQGLKTFTGSSGKTYKLKRTLDDSGIDVDLPTSLLSKQPRVHLGERIAMSAENQEHANTERSKNVSDNKKLKKKVGKSSDKKAMEDYIPCRRVKREASLNAAARVNIMYEKEVSPPKPNRKQSTSSTGSAEKGKKNVTKAVAKKPILNTKKISPKKFSKDIGKNTKKKKKKKKGKPEQGKSKTKVTDEKVKSIKGVQVKKGKGTPPKSAKTISIMSKYKQMGGKKKGTNKNGKTSKKSPKVTNSHPRKWKLSDKDQTKSKSVKVDTQTAARTHLSAAPKTSFSSVQCVGCYRRAMCSSNGKLYWGQSDFGEGKDGVSDETACHLDASTPPYTSVPSRVQLMEGSPYVNTVVPHPTLPACPRCAQITTPPCQSYTLGGIGSISSVQVVSYPQHFSSTYPISYPTSHSALPHCGCPACYSATGIYYPPTSSPMPHQPHPHDACHVSTPSIPIHISESDESKSDVDIDVGEPEDIKPILSSLTVHDIPGTSRRKGSSSSQKDSHKKAGEKKVRVTLSKMKKTAEKSYERQKSKDEKKEAKKKPKYNKTLSRHGWEFDGEPERKKIMSLWLGTSVEADCYQAIRHVDGDVIRVRECVLLCSGPKKTDIPYVAKVTNFWEHPHDGEMMMSLLWYYQPEHTESGRKPYHADCEVFASKHKDENSVACIDDKGYVLTFAEYCRYRADLQRQESGVCPHPRVVPSSDEDYVRSGKLPPPGCDPNNVYLCRQVYDFKLKRILKNPS